ncbi:hypothetical protein [Actinomadura geliboluensis]|uniref:hypothetical protein n=1 Tax=Actinomadura geliboluensis TaxID=882440 RepID=UPI003686E2C1
MQLHHMVSTRQVGDTIVNRYRVSPIEVLRPDQGSSVMEVRCGACDGVIRLRVHSVQRTRRARRRWLGLVTLALLVVAAGSFEIFRFESGHYGDPEFLFIVTPVAWILGLAAAVFLSFRWHQEDGVRITGQPTPGARHELLPFVH